MTISVRLSDEDTELIKTYANMNNISLSDLIRNAVLEKIEDEYDLECYNKAMKEYKENPDHFKGNVADFTTVMRVVLTTSSMTPNLYDIMNILGRDRMLKRLEIFKENY